MASKTALVIDDEPDIRELLAITLSRMDINADLADSVTSAKRRLSEKTYNLCLTDLRLPDGNGIDIVNHIQQQYPELPVAVISAHGSMDVAIDAMKSGAFDFVNKPIDLNALRKLVDSALVSNQLAAKKSSVNIIGESPNVLQLKASIKKLARSQAPVYVSGESGSGKELVARAIHSLGPRSEHPFVPVNCGAIPTELMESEFFGHKKGSFTGANVDKKGLFQAADGGTLFLDEVADLPLDMQVKLLRAIQEKAVRPVGEQNEIQTDVRILSATHKDLQELVDKGTFRQDLFYRLNVIQLTVPPLRERQEDIPALIDFFLKRLDQDDSSLNTKITKKANEALYSHNFPGNIRELENILERAFTLCEDQTIQAEDLQLNDYQSSHSGPERRKLQASHYHQCLNYESIDEYLAEIEKEILSDALEHVRWNKTLAAKKLNISFRSFRYRLQKLNMDEED